MIVPTHNRRYRVRHGRRAVWTCTLVLCCLLSSGCASIVHSGSRALPFKSRPVGATVEIFSENGELINQDRTPFVATLSPKSRYFRGARYRMRVTAEGYEPMDINIVPRVSGWYIGNVLFGGLIGLLVVDPLTGSMYNLRPEEVSESLSEDEKGVIADGKGFMVVLSSELGSDATSSLQPHDGQ